MDQSSIDNQTDEAMGWAAEGKKLAVDIPEVSFKDAATFVAEMTPIVGDFMAAKEVYDELQKDEPNYYLAGALGGATLIGLIPGVGDVAAKAIKKGAKEVFDVAKRVEVDPNAMGSGLGNVRLKPKVSALKENPKAEMVNTSTINNTIPKGNKPRYDVGKIDTVADYNAEDWMYDDFAKTGKLTLKESIFKEGIKEPIEIMVSKKTGDMVLGEGNHRLKAATELGMDEVPVVVYVKNDLGFIDGEVPAKIDTKGLKSGEYYSLSEIDLDSRMIQGKKPAGQGSFQYIRKDGTFSSEPDPTRFTPMRDTNTADTFPPAENAARTQIAGTLPTYKKADTLLTELSGEGKTLDFGAGLGLSKKELGFDTYEPFPKGDFTPDFNSPADIPSNAYKKVTNLNVLNVVPREVRDGIVKDIGRVLEPNGRAVITTRGRDVMDAKGTAGPEPMSIITSRDTYQKGFTQPELSSYITETLGEGFEVTNNKLGAAGVTVHKLPTGNFNEGGIAMNDQTVQAFALGGLAEDVDPVSGNEVPVGSMPEEVRDDIPAQLSEGEYVVPADVVRFFGVKFFEDIRAEAKQGFAQMEANGRVGGEPMGMEMGGDELPFDVSELQIVDDGEPEQPMMNKGGYISGYSDGGYNPYGVSGKGFEIITYVGPNGEKIYIQFHDGNNLTPIPAGYTAEASTSEQVSEQTTAKVSSLAPSPVEKNNNTAHEEMMGEESEYTDWSNPEEGTPEKFQEVIDQMTGVGGKASMGIATLLGGPLMGVGIKSLMKLQTNAMIDGIQTQIDDPNTGEIQKNKLLQIQYQMQGKDKDGNDDSSKKGNIDNLFDMDTYKGNSLSESIANMFTAKDGKSYRDGQLIDDATGKPIAAGIMNSTSNDTPIVAPVQPVSQAQPNEDNNSSHEDMMATATEFAPKKSPRPRKR